MIIDANNSPLETSLNYNYANDTWGFNPFYQQYFTIFYAAGTGVGVVNVACSWRGEPV